MAKIAFIGSRELSQFDPVWVELYTQAAIQAARFGHIVITGAAQGADQLAAHTALQHNGKVELVLPWSKYECGWWQPLQLEHPSLLTTVTYSSVVHDTWTQSVYDHHPVAHQISDGAFRLHARNFGIIEGAKYVVALPSLTRPGGGGTGQGIRIAVTLNKTLFDLTTADGRDRLSRGMRGK
jgi:hypothetical protein